jgi:hypothetical protein
MQTIFTEKTFQKTLATPCMMQGQFNQHNGKIKRDIQQKRKRKATNKEASGQGGENGRAEKQRI